MSLDVILIIVAVVLGILYFIKRSGRTRRKG
jgi:hypothetical protein